VGNIGRENIFLAAAKVDIDKAERRISALQPSVSSVDNEEKVVGLHHRFTKSRSSGSQPTPDSEHRSWRGNHGLI
jgi:hypothetical protein